MPFHWCADETIALLSAIPFIGYFFARLHAWWHKKFNHPCHEEGCKDTHIHHVQVEYTCDHGKTLHEACPDCPNGGWPDNEELNEVGYKLTTRGLVAGSILNHGPMTHEQVVALHPNEDPDAIHTAINELVEEGRLILDGDLLTEGDLFG